MYLVLVMNYATFTLPPLPPRFYVSLLACHHTRATAKLKVRCYISEILLCETMTVSEIKFCTRVGTFLKGTWTLS